MAKGPDGPGGSSSGYPHFKGGGSNVVDVVYTGSDAGDRIGQVLGEIATPIPKEVVGELFPNGAGGIASINQAGLTATRACQMEIDGAQTQINMGTPITEVMVGVKSRAEAALEANKNAAICACTAFCIKAYLRECPAQLGGISSADKTKHHEFSELSFMDLFGLLPKGSRIKAEQVGRKVFSFFLDHGLGRRNGFSPVQVPQDGEDADLAQDHLFSWVAKYRPENRKRAKRNKVFGSDIYRQLDLGL